MTPRTRLLLAALLLAAVPLASAAHGGSAATVARTLLALSALAGLALWLVRGRGLAAVPAPFRAAPRLHVIQRVGLAPRTGLALVEVDGRPYLVVHGDGYARMRPARRAALVAPPALTRTGA